MLQMQGVRKAFDTAAGPYVALDGIDLDIESGELFCLLGPSGCGKSTLLNMLAGFEAPTAGVLRCGGHAIRGPGRERVMLFQDASSALLPWLSASENVRFALRARRAAAGVHGDTVARLLEMVDLSAHANKTPTQLSGGMRQRLQIARGLAADPAVLLMDEPFGALDAFTRRRMHRVLLDVWVRTRITVVFVTHDIGEAILLADRIGVLSVGPDSHFLQVMPVDAERPRDLLSPESARLMGTIERLLEPELARAAALEEDSTTAAWVGTTASARRTRSRSAAWQDRSHP